ncbi:MAG: PAAR-like domain-containing protein [Allorhizobium sp.]
MAKPIATKNGICFAFPDVLKTPTPGGDVPMPYPNIAQLSAADGAATNVNAGGNAVILESSKVGSSSGGEPGVGGGVKVAAKHLADCTFKTFSKSVKANGKGIVRQFDTTDQNGGNASGQVMVGYPTVLVGD